MTSLDRISQHELDGILSSRLKQDWLDDNYFLTLIFNCLSIALPIFEKAIIKTISSHNTDDLPLVDREEAERLVLEEIKHSKFHFTYNKCLQKSNGYDIKKLELSYVKMFQDKRFVDPKTRLAMVVCGEFITAQFANYSINHIFSNTKVEPFMAEFWTWHGHEELSHQDVARDIYDKTYNDQEFLSETMQLFSKNLLKAFRFNLAIMLINDGHTMSCFMKWFKKEFLAENSSFKTEVVSKIENY